MQRYEHGGDIYGGDKIAVDFSVNTNPLGMPPEVVQALRDNISSFSKYPDTKYRILREKISQCWGVESSRILCGAGAADMIFRVCACLKPKTALVLAPTFSEYERPVKLFGGSIKEYPLEEKNGFALTDSILDAITHDIDMAFICNPNNPTGRLTPDGTLLKLLKKCAEQKVVLVIDECFLDFTNGKSMAKYLPEYPNLLILKAFTKLYSLAGVRLGCLLGDGELLRNIAEYGPEWAVSVPAQVAGAAALSAEPQWTEKTRAFVENERARMSTALTQAGVRVFTSDTNFLLLKCPENIIEKLKNKGILARACDNFSGLDGRFVRVAVKTEAENDMLIKAVAEVING